MKHRTGGIGLMHCRTILTSASVMGLPTLNTHRRYSALTLVAALAVITALVNPIAAQTFRGTILGTVTDPNGAVIPEATVTAKNVGTGIERSTDDRLVRELHPDGTANRNLCGDCAKVRFRQIPN